MGEISRCIARRRAGFRRRVLLVAGLTAVSLATLAGPGSVSAAQAVPTQTPAPAPVDIAGQWQGTLQDGGSYRRLVLKIARTGDGWSATFYSIDQDAQPFTASSLTLDGATFRATIDALGLTFKGTLSADGNTIVGRRIQGSSSLPLTLERAAGKAAWKIPQPPPPPKLMATDADVSFKKATIKQNGSGGVRPYGFRLDGRTFSTLDTSLADLISYAYEVQARQVVGGPDWVDQARYDIDATLGEKGEPSHQQLRAMVKKLLADRFRLTFHADKIEMPAYVLTVGNNGPKLAPTQFQGPLPGIGETPGPGGMAIAARNATLEDFTVFLQLIVLDRPVVDLTGLTGRFDFRFTYTPDGSQFNGHPPRLPAAMQPTMPAPDLFDAIRQQLGLELNAEKTFVDVIAIDRAERPAKK